ncbi:biopolymer transporter ExbB [Burkholderia sp. Leaf177]|uniref:MotA/TolQ/ExbB proton channel family protein n=1 Tax=Burkholderia sp. Leaf177 TaxID=1736287 RepID=UPI0006FD9253|nr:MotA/TolQ/ExbB proton channel family protein [Burkholderia sp. Leaf177]KQR90299.1 biopolymer transporter ExbB [Burkholderia sp. Leaf177]
MQDWGGIVAAAQVGGWVVYPLTLLAVLAIAIAIDRAYVFSRFAGEPSTRIDTLPAQHAFRRLDATFVMQPGTPLWLYETRAQSLATRIERDMSRGFWVLETIVTAAPLLGLLGTIVGMMHSFQLFGGSGLVNPGGVTGGVAQSLVATAIGLIVALFALFAFNYFSRRLERLIDDLELYANERLAGVRLHAENDLAGTGKVQ